ncbi:mediator complex subunit MED14-domain-containing protein [Mrakia frigida]|uniref:Rgr1p n=1 Tax=Mrakia frigida TaxID=29902 RepID=UPI003FCBFC36
MDRGSPSMVAPSSIPTPPSHSQGSTLTTKKITLTIPSNFQPSSTSSRHTSPLPPPPPPQPNPSASASPSKQQSLHSYPSPPIGEGEMISSEILERELPDVASPDLVPLNLVVDAVIQDVYQRLVELGEVLPSLHESARAAQIFQFSLYSRRQVVKLLALVRWSKESEVVAKCMNINAFLTRQNKQFDEAIEQLTVLRTGLDGTRLRNPDLLTALDVLTTGTYQRLPQRFQTDFLPPSPLTDRSILRALLDLNNVIAYRLKVKEVVPVQMRNYRIADGRAYFSCPGLFEASLSLTGAQKVEEFDSEEVKKEKVQSGKLGGNWYLVEMAFSFNMAESEDGPDEELRKEFPTKPPRATFDEIAHYASMLLIPPTPPPPPPETAAAGSLPDRPFDPLASHIVAASSPFDGGNGTGGDVKFKFSLGDGEQVQVVEGGEEEKKEVVVDAPLVRVYNLLQSLSLGYQLEILFRQAQRIKSLGWADCFSLEMEKDRKSFKISYWPRQRPLPRSSAHQPSASAPPQLGISVGGTFTVSLIDRAQTTSAATTLNRILNEVEGEVKSKMSVTEGAAGGAVRVSDRVLEMELCVVWEADKKWSTGIDLSEGTKEIRLEFKVDSSNLDLESILLDMVRKHANGLVRALYRKTFTHPSMAVLYDLAGGDIVLEQKDDEPSKLLVRIHGDEFITVSMDPRSGRISIRDAGDVIPSDDTRLVQAAKAVNLDPSTLNDILIRLKLTTVTDDLDLKFNYLGLTALRKLVFKPGELSKFGSSARLFLYVPLPDTPSHFFVAVMTQATFRFALISVRLVIENGLRWLVIEDVGWLDDEKLLAAKVVERRARAGVGVVLGKRKFVDQEVGFGFGRGSGGEANKKRNRFYVDVEDLRELYSYSLARVASYKVEQQLKSRHIPYELVSSSSDRKGKGRAFNSSSSPMESSVPIISVQARDLLKSVPAAVDVALPKIQMRVRNWWGEEKCQVVTSIKLRQQPTLSLAGRKQEMSSPSRNVLIDTSTSVVSFVTENIEGCVDALTEEFSRVGKLAVIASEINRSKDPNLKMTYFDLQTATFVYAPGLIVSIGWRSAPLESRSPGTYDVTFEVVPNEDEGEDGRKRVNPHSAMASLFRDRLNESDEAGSLLDFIQLLRTTLPLLQQADSVLVLPPKQDLTIKLWPKSVSCFCFVYEKGATR